LGARSQKGGTLGEKGGIIFGAKTRGFTQGGLKERKEWVFQGRKNV